MDRIKKELQKLISLQDKCNDRGGFIWVGLFPTHKEVIDEIHSLEDKLKPDPLGR